MPETFCRLKTKNEIAVELSAILLSLMDFDSN